jgi:hypothetical protein
MGYGGSSLAGGSAKAQFDKDFDKKIGIARGEGDSEFVYVFWEENLRAT